VLIPATLRAGLRPRLVWKPRHPAVKKLLSLSFWTIGFVTANIVALTIVRNLTEPGSSNAFAYLIGFTFFILPHGLLGVSIATTFQGRAVSTDSSSSGSCTRSGVRVAFISGRSAPPARRRV